MIICSCHNINHTELEEFLAQNPHLNAEHVSKLTKAGTDCGICFETIEEMVKVLGKAKENTNNREKNSNHQVNYWEDK